MYARQSRAMWVYGPDSSATLSKPDLIVVKFMNGEQSSADSSIIDKVVIEPPGVRILWNDGRRSHFHSIWLRDNCGCEKCRVVQSGERLLFTADIADDLAISDAATDDAGHLRIGWSDGHLSVYDRAWLAEYDYSSPSDMRCRERITLWGRDDYLPAFEHDALSASKTTLLEFLDAMHERGAAIVRNTPAVDGEVVRFAESIGVVRTVAFGIIHDVINNPGGYNVAHTALELKPHTDLASYTWPPSLQLLHYLSNAVMGGETVLVDGWNVLAALKCESPESYELLSTVSVPFKIFSATDDTYAEEPIIQHHPDGRIRVFRYSNQTVQPLRVRTDLVEPFYKAYKQLGRLISDERFRLVIKAESGDMLTIHNHRVLHGRLAYDPSSGSRHLQDLYMEWDDVMAKRRVLRGHLPRAAWPENVRLQIDR